MVLSQERMLAGRVGEVCFAAGDVSEVPRGTTETYPGVVSTCVSEVSGRP